MNHSKGYSLIELMIVIAIVGILSAVAYGMYTDHVISSNRTEARAALQQAAGTLEKCKSLYGNYNAANCNYADFTSESNYYDIRANGTITGSAFTLTATPAVGSRQVADTECTSLTLTNAGVKGGTGTDPTECW
jgi:type IV pilus assembly protein PilE